MTNTPGYNRFKFQLKDMFTKTSLIATGSAGAGQVLVCTAGASTPLTLTDRFGTALNNPLALTRGFADFCVALANLTVDLYIQSPTGHCIQIKGVAPGGLNEYEIDTSVRRTSMIIPFSFAQAGANTEFNTGFLLPSNGRILDRLHGAGINVTTVETAGGKTINVGLLSSQSGGNASGLINGSSTATLGQVTGTNGALFSSNAPALAVTQTANAISYTLSASSVAAAGFILLPLELDQA